MERMASFGYWVRRRRKVLDLTQEALARQVGCAEVTIKKIEADERRPSRQIAERLADCLQIAPAERAAFVRAARGELAADRLEMPPQPAPPAPAAPLPSGTITFLFTDIAGSTQLWERHPAAMRSALARHDAILRHAVATHRGVVVKSIGDGAHAVFTGVSDAAMAALAAQRALQAEPWGEIGALRVRMALHTGVAEERDGDYFGPALNLAARLLAAGHGGQVLLSQVTQALLREQLPRAVELRDLGAHRLKDLIHPEQIFQLVDPDLPSAFPPLRTLAAQPTNPPAPTSPLLTTKLYVPPARPNLVPRPRLIARLQSGLTGKLTLLAAPAGFGKTTLLSDWLAPNDERGTINNERSAAHVHRSSFIVHRLDVAWVSLDAGDNDPPRFWSYVCAALETLLPGVAETALALLQSSQPPPAETLLPSLLNAVSARAADCVLVLDDYHAIEEAAIHAAPTRRCRSLGCGRAAN
jgi:class 3 adenylate cyclase